MRICYFLLSIFLSANLWADGSVRLANLVEDIGTNALSLIRVSNAGSAAFLATYQKPSGDGTSSSSPGRTWIPVRNGGGQQNHVTISDPSAVPDLQAGTGGFQAYLRVTNATGFTRYLYAAVQDPENTAEYLVITGALGTFSSRAETYLAWGNVSIPGICDNIDCQTISGGSTTGTKNVLIYFFLDAQSNLGPGFQITPSAYSGGVYLRTYLSVRLPQGIIDFTELKRGDGRLKGIFSGTTINDFNRTLAVVNGQGGGLSSGPIQSALAVAGSQLLDLETNTSAGEVNIRPLINGVTYEVALLFEDKYQFATQISAPLTETPIAIEALLEKQACYILSAGFQEKHFVTDYFRSLRDNFLLKLDLGRSFVQWYYRTAPEFAPVIYSSPILALIVRILAYTLWFLLNLALLAAPIAFIIWLLNKISQRQQYGRSQ
jgi:hypothetical protein